MRVLSIRIILSLIVLFMNLGFVRTVESYSVIRVIDGDTIDVDFNGTVERVRFLHVNTPESIHRDKKQNTPMGKVASSYTKKRLSGKSVDLEFEGKMRGNYGRLLAYVYVDGSNFNVELVRMGLSPYYTKYGASKKYHYQFKTAEQQARTEQRNLWGDPALTENYLRLKSNFGQRKQNTPPLEANGPFVASKNSKVFYLPYCKWAKKIKPGNRVQLNTRDVAGKKGKRPCMACLSSNKYYWDIKK